MEARTSKPLFVLVQKGISPDAKQKALIKEAREWASGGITADFTSPADLARKITTALHRWQLAESAGRVDEGQLRSRALALVAGEDKNRSSSHRSSSILVIALVGGPEQTIIRPSELASQSLARALRDKLLFGEFNIFTDEPRYKVRAEGSSAGPRAKGPSF